MTTLYQRFTYKPPMGTNAPMRRFYVATPITWIAARDRLVAAGIVDRTVNGWYLSVDPSDYIERLAAPLP